MPEVTYKTTMNLAPETIWEFIQDMNNWAPMVTGYQEHEEIDETDSIWTLKGDVGILARIVKFRAHVTEWAGPEKVTFTLEGITEKMDGGGVLLIRPMGGDDGDAEPAPAPKRPWFFRRFLNWIARRMFRRIHGDGPQRALLEAGAAQSELEFTLRMDAGGVTGPLVNAMLGPALEPAAEDLANKIAAHLEQLHGVEAAA